MTGRLIAAFILVLAAATASPGRLAAHTAPHDPQDDILASVGVDERLGGAVPADAVFIDQDGKAARLGDLLSGGPVVLTLNYFTCPMLCPLTLRNLLGAANGMAGIILARDFRILTVSIDPDETPAAARARAGEMHALIPEIGNPGSRWPFLRSDAKSVAALAGAVGFRYRKVGAEFAHPDVSIVLTPGGKVSRYLYGIEQDPRDLKLALIEAAGGRIGGSAAVNRVLLYCFHYDPVGKRYALYARNIMKAGGVFTLVILGSLYYILWKRKSRGKAATGGGTA